MPNRILRRPSFERFRRGGNHVRLQEGGLCGSPPSSSSSYATEPMSSVELTDTVEDREVVKLLDSLLNEQGELTQRLRDFQEQLQTGSVGESLLVSPSFQETLARLSAAQQQQRELLSAARERVARDYPMLLVQSRTLLELLSAVTDAAKAAGDDASPPTTPGRDLLGEPDLIGESSPNLMGEPDLLGGGSQLFQPAPSLNPFISGGVPPRAAGGGGSSVYQSDLV